jgi:hypothetical protein
MATDDENDIKTRLMTLLNVSHLKYGFRHRSDDSASESPEPSSKRVKLNKRKTQSPMVQTEGSNIETIEEGPRTEDQAGALQGSADATDIGLATSEASAMYNS